MGREKDWIGAFSNLRCRCLTIFSDDIVVWDTTLTSREVTSLVKYERRKEFCSVIFVGTEEWLGWWGQS